VTKNKTKKKKTLPLVEGK